jgi:8-oxo-dGTP pyrophosphatase MutT (NUDIX family)
VALGEVRDLFARRERGAPPPAPAAALAALFDEDSEARVILIRRAIALPRHAGEVALPGGRVEAGEGMVATALREAEEEVGLAAAGVEVVGWLDRVVGATSGSVVTPVVGLLGGRPQLVAEPAEVEAVFDVALSELMGTYRQERWRIPGSEAGERAMHFFELGEDTVWGMTARILYQLLCELTGRTGPPPPER